MVAIERLRLRQIDIWGEGVVVPSREIITTGMIASEVVSSLLDVYDVERFSYTKYEPDSTYPIDVNQPYWWGDWKGVGQLEKLSEDIFLNSLSLYHFEGDTILVSEILGVGSRVRIEGETKHIPMLDFDFSEDEADIEEVLDIDLPRGVLLRTDNSFHYYGLDLLGESGWRKWINRLVKLKDSEKLFGGTYLEMCLERDYNALRIWNYPGTSKKQTPFVVGRI